MQDIKEYPISIASLDLWRLKFAIQTAVFDKGAFDALRRVELIHSTTEYITNPNAKDWAQRAIALCQFAKSRYNNAKISNTSYVTYAINSISNDNTSPEFAIMRDFRKHLYKLNDDIGALFDPSVDENATTSLLNQVRMSKTLDVNIIDWNIYRLNVDNHTRQMYEIACKILDTSDKDTRDKLMFSTRPLFEHHLKDHKTAINVQKQVLKKLYNIRTSLPQVSGGSTKRKTARWERTKRTANVKCGRGKPMTTKTVYRNTMTGELRVRKMVASKDGTKRASYVKF